MPNISRQPGNHESAGKRLSGNTRKGNQTLRSGLMQSAHVASLGLI
ncbi:hypothetical protein [Scytonema sp. PCC 10023]